MEVLGLFGVMAGSAVAIAIFLAIFFLVEKSKEHRQYLWTGLILVAIALRIGKSIFFFLLNDMAPFGLALGFLGLASIGPITWWLVDGVNRSRGHLAIHLLLPFGGAAACWITSPSNFESLFYESATLVLLGYLVASWRFGLKHRNEVAFPWKRAVLIMVTGVWIALVYQHLANSMMDYALGALIASLFIYWLFFQSFRQSVLSKGSQVILPDAAKEDVRTAFEERKLHREAGINLQLLSTRLDIPPYLITKAVKELYEKTFPETLNHFRIKDLKQMLLDPKMEHLKIEAIAYEVGFSSPSAFYAAFKKETGQTPTMYQKKALMSA